MPDEQLTNDDGATLETGHTAITSELPDDDADIESSAVEVEQRGQKVKLAPVGAIVAERKGRRDAMTKAKELEGQLATATARAAKAESDNASLAPLVNAMRARPDLLEAALKGTQPSTRQATTQPSDTGVDETTAREIALEYELYDAQGQPDLARGRRVASRLGNMVRTAVNEATEPLRRGITGDKASQNLATLNAYVKQGDISQGALEAVCKMVPAELLADEKVMSVLYYTARGIDAANGKGGKRTDDAGDDGTGRRPSAPIVTETTGRRAGGKAALNDVDRLVARSRGLSDDQYRTYLTDVPEGGSVELE